MKGAYGQSFVEEFKSQFMLLVQRGVDINQAYDFLSSLV